MAAIRSPHLFAPEFEGEIEITGLPADFFARMERRVETGLILPGNRSRANYRVRERSADEIAFGAGDFWTAYAVGLNEVTLRRPAPDRIAYHVSFGGWNRGAVIHSGLLGLILVGLYLSLPQMRRDVHATPTGPAIFFGIVGFFALLWPWLLTALHRPHAARLLERIVREVAASVSPA
jgi:hypothetical protein